MSDPRQTILQELHNRWQAIFSQLHEGSDVPPAQRLRTEGVMESAHSLGLLSIDEIQAEMAQVYLTVCGRSFEQALGEDWQQLYPFPQVPGYGVRAPVYLSTSD